MEVRIFLKHYQIVNRSGTNIVYKGSSPATLKAVAGNVPQTTFIDFTSDIESPEKLKLMWAKSNTETTNEVFGNSGNNVVKTASGVLKISGAAYQFIKAWCVDNVAAPLNAVEVRIVTTCGSFERYVIRSEQLKWCEGEYVCEYDVNINQPDTELKCIQRTVISDNHLGWFQTTPRGGKQHPRFSYCNEARPNGLLVSLWILMEMMMPIIDIIFIVLAIVLLVINIINVIIGIITSIVSFITSVLGFGGDAIVEPEWNAIPEYSLGAFIDAIKQYFVESCGCGREHPAPLIRDYIYNVCAKCGVTVDEVTAPVFFSKVWNIDFITSTGANLRGQPNPYYNSTFLNAPKQRGIRRFKSLNFFKTPAMDNTTFFINENAPILALNDFLDLVLGAFNHDWNLRGGKLFIWRTDWFDTGAVLYNFKTNSADRLKILEGVCFEWNEKRMPAYSQGLYMKDAIESCGNEVLNQMNGVIDGLVSYTDDSNNPLFEGKDDKHITLGATHFRFDGSTGDYIYDAMQSVINFDFLTAWVHVLFRDVDSWISKYANYALLFSDEICDMPKIIIWNGGSYLAAQSVFDMVAVNNELVPTNPVPQINPKYNPDSSNNYLVQNWNSRHPPKSSVLGNDRAGFGGGPGVYEVNARIFGIDRIVARNAARLVNYPMYYNPGYVGTLWDNFFYLIDPRLNPNLLLNFTVKICASCEDIQRLKLTGDASEIQLGARVLVESTYYGEGIINEIELDLDPENEIGSHITLKGTL